jgi:glutathione synthase/RimK-type ligase-like ATP-grasp enzyme
MTLPNRERVLVALVREIAAEQDMQLDSFSHDWLLRLERGGRARHVLGYNFELNSATAQMITSDKAATADILAAQGIAHVAHQLFLHPRLGGYVSAEGNWSRMLAYAEAQGYPLVVKANEGTGGGQVYRVESAPELEAAVQRLFASQRGISLSPFLEIEQEYRAIVLDDACELLYAKRRPALSGDGQSTVLELIEKALLAGSINGELASQALDSAAGDIKRVLDKDQELLLGWKHNLGAGARPLLLESGETYDELAALAERARSAVGIRFTSVDIVQVGGELAVLEVNSGVMMEYFVQHYPEQRESAKAIYAKAIQKMFAAA